MLQRAASNAYSWWWAGHIRTKQSKWLEQNLQDMEEKVQSVLKLLEQDGDSFAKRAEMYYKRRPELINFVEESYRAFRALAERYDHLSTELQNANNTLATCFPDQYQLMDDDDDYGTPRNPRIPPQVPAGNASNIPKVPKPPVKVFKGLIQKATKQMKNKKPSKASDSNKSVAKSGLSIADAVSEIDKLQKDILTLQTEKEFIKSSYQSGLEKYWSIENQIMEKQQKVCKLQDEFSIEKVIEDDEARKLMAETALKSCQETLAQLQDTQENSAAVAREEYERIEVARQKLKSLRHEFLHDKADEEKPYEEADPTKTGDVKRSSSQDFAELVQVVQEKHKMEVKQEKFKEQFEKSSMVSITVTELVEKIDELVNKVVSLETDVSCQTVLINRLRSESDELHSQIRTLEDDKATLNEGTHDLKKKLKELEEKLKEIQDLNQNVENQNSNLQTHFAEAQSSLDHLSNKLSLVMPENELDIDGSSEEQESSLPDNTLQKEQEKQKDLPSGGNGSLDPTKIADFHVKEEQDFGVSANRQGEGKKSRKKTVTFRDLTPQVEKEEQTSIQSGHNLQKAEAKAETENKELNCRTMLLTGVEEKEKIPLTEYTEVLRNYKEAKRKLSDFEKKERDDQVEVSMQIRELNNAIAKRDEEIQHLRHKLNSLQGSLSENKDVKEGASSSSGPPEEQKTKPEDRTKDAVLEDEEDEDDNFISFGQPAAMSHVEEKLRMDIDAILEENLDFWLRFSTSFHQIQKFKSTVEDLQDEISKIRENKKQEESATNDVKSDVRPIYKHLKEIETELAMWLEQSVSLKDELERRFSSLCNIQEKITLALKEGVEEEEIKFSSHQAAKFQGEVLNMKQENNKVRDELQAGVDHITSLQVEVDRTLRKLNEEFRLSRDQSGQSANRPSIPLRSFIFGAKPKKQKASIFSCMHPNRKYQVLRAGIPL